MLNIGFVQATDRIQNILSLENQLTTTDYQKNQFMDCVDMKIRYDESVDRLDPMYDADMAPAGVVGEYMYASAVGVNKLLTNMDKAMSASTQKELFDLMFSGVSMPNKVYYMKSSDPDHFYTIGTSGSIKLSKSGYLDKGLIARCFLNAKAAIIMECKGREYLDHNEPVISQQNRLTRNTLVNMINNCVYSRRLFLRNVLFLINHAQTKNKLSTEFLDTLPNHHLNYNTFNMDDCMDVSGYDGISTEYVQSTCALFDAVENLLAISDHITKFGITEEGMSLLNDTLAMANITYSAEGILNSIINGVKSILEKIVNFIKNIINKLADIISSGWKKLMSFFKKNDKPLPKDKVDKFNSLMSKGHSSEGFGARFEGFGGGFELRGDHFLQQLKQDTSGTFVQKNGKFAPISQVESVIKLYSSYVSECLVAALDGNKEPSWNAPSISYANDAYAAGWSEISKLDTLVDTIERGLSNWYSLKNKVESKINSMKTDTDDINKEYVKNLRSSLDSMISTSKMFATIANACKSAIRAKSKCVDWGTNIPTFDLSDSKPSDEPEWDRGNIRIPSFDN